MTDLRAHLIRRITAGGPISVAEYMAECLTHPDMGYYATRDPLGTAGDFITAPEISQMFGELIGLSLAQSWLDQGAPSPFVLAEAGPGRGTLMADILRATRSVPGFHDGLDLHLIEISEPLKAIQQNTIGRDDITWHDSVASLPDLPLFLIANEFFDALPIRQFQRDGDGWRERQIGVQEGMLTFGLAGPVVPGGLDHRLDDTKPGDLVEFCAAGQHAAQQIGQRIADHGGAALIVDYGDWRSLGDTFQALENHAAVDPLTRPGVADLTAHVDFETLANATPSRFSRLTPQGVFLERLGITARAQALAKNLSGEALQNHIAAHRRLTHSAEMGTLFKVLAFYPDGAAPPPGLDP
ncbi:MULTISPECIES: class I SAM-dependent methyltransferase [unclassified Roseovarius]|uniref:class I SAM-dependent methyltransferase n=1 Tax=unclassified Roseovarius TaxID=2614913 RepID=UPI00274001A8|nr:MULTISPECIES: SAM-dependent methyltransferase [unclassified Roseovarius]